MQRGGQFVIRSFVKFEMKILVEDLILNILTHVGHTSCNEGGDTVVVDLSPLTHAVERVVRGAALGLTYIHSSELHIGVLRLHGGKVVGQVDVKRWSNNKVGDTVATLLRFV